MPSGGYHTLYSRSAAVGIQRPRLSRLLKKLGEIPVDATEVESGNIVFEAAKILPLIKAFSTAILMQDVPDYLGASKFQVATLYRVGIVQPLIPRIGRGSVRHVVFGQQHLDDLLKRIAELPELDEAAEGQFYPISYACQRGAGVFEDIFIDILEGRVQGFRRPRKTGIGAIHVDVASFGRIKKTA